MLYNVQPRGGGVGHEIGGFSPYEIGSAPRGRGRVQPRGLGQGRKGFSPADAGYALNCPLQPFRRRFSPQRAGLRSLMTVRSRC